jgi:hypothetical protein
VEYFWIDQDYRCMTAHYSSGSSFCKLRVSEKPSQQVAFCGGKHKSNGHNAIFCFNQGGDCFVQCFDNECTKQNDNYMGRRIFRLPTNVCEDVDHAFNELV